MRTLDHRFVHRRHEPARLGHRHPEGVFEVAASNSMQRPPPPRPRRGGPGRARVAARDEYLQAAEAGPDPEGPSSYPRMGAGGTARRGREAHARGGGRASCGRTSSWSAAGPAGDVIKLGTWMKRSSPPYADVATVVLVPQPSDRVNDVVPSAVTPCTPIWDQGSCAPTRARTDAVRHRLARMRGRRPRNTSPSVVCATQVARPATSDQPPDRWRGGGVLR